MVNHIWSVYRSDNGVPRIDWLIDINISRSYNLDLYMIDHIWSIIYDQSYMINHMWSIIYDQSYTVYLQIGSCGTPRCQHHAASRVQDLIFTTPCWQHPNLAYMNICFRCVVFVHYRIWLSYMISHIWLIIYDQSYMVWVQIIKIDTPGCQPHAARILLVWWLSTGASNPTFHHASTYICPIGTYMIYHIWVTIYD